MNDKYKDGALIKLEDPDYGEGKWFVASIAGNLKGGNDLDEFLSQDRMTEALSTVINGTMMLFQELNENKPNTGKFIWKGVKEGIGIGLFAGILAAFGIPPPTD